MRQRILFSIFLGVDVESSMFLYPILSISSLCEYCFLIVFFFFWK